MNNKRFSRRSRRRSRNKPFVGLLLGAALLACAAKGRAGAPDWLRAAARLSLPHYPDETNAVVLVSEQITTVRDDGEIRTLYRHAYKILRPEGRERGLIGVYFDNETRLTSLKAWCIPATGAEYEVKEKDAIETGISPEALYQDTRYKVRGSPLPTRGT